MSPTHFGMPSSPDRDTWLCAFKWFPNIIAPPKGFYLGENRNVSSSHWFYCKFNQLEERISRRRSSDTKILPVAHRKQEVGGEGGVRPPSLDRGDGFMDGLSNIVDVLGGQTAHVDATAGQQVHMLLLDQVLHLFDCKTHYTVTVTQSVEEEELMFRDTTSPHQRTSGDKGPLFLGLKVNTPQRVRSTAG